MGKQYQQLNDPLTNFIARQKMYFVGTAAADGRVNVSPKGMDSLRVVAPDRVVWLNLTGSGNETAAHLRELPRITLMFCAFEGDPMILRVYGQARALHPRDPEWATLLALFPKFEGTRQLVDVAVELVQTSCGMGVPLLDFKAERDQLEQWAARKGPAGVRAYWQEKNQVSLDGKPTDILPK